MWNIKKTMSDGVTVPEIDILYDKGIKSGSTGGKILGAGGGGFILFYVPRNSQEDFELKMKDERFLDFKFEKHGTKIIFVEN